MKMFAVLFFTVFMSVTAMAQKLSLNQVINAAYGNKVVLEADTLLYVLSECSPFIEIKPSKKDEIKISVFKNKDQIIRSLSNADAHLLKVGLSDVSLGKLVMTVAVYKINSNIFTEKDHFLIFHDERTVECVLSSKKEWVYSKTINVKKHLTD
jgi:hypothetical protein